RVGGTWRENTYPGCACDIRSHLYSYSFEPKTDWSREFASQPEILGYIEHCVDKYGLRPHIRFGAEMTGAEYDDDAAVWTVSTGDGGTVRAHAVVAGLGPLHLPSIPELPGLERFEGKAFHSAEWDHDHDLTGRRVAVIGTGASAIQLVPQVAGQAGHLTVFQRTAPWIIPRPDRPFSESEKRWFRRVPGARFLYRNMIYWLQESFVLGFEHPNLIKAAERLGRWHLERQVHDPEVRRKLTPAYTLGCKRTLVSSDYYPAFNRPDVELETAGITEIRERSIVTTDGREIEVDTIVFGTGFHVTDAMADLHIVGREGLKIQDAWRDGMVAHLGTTVAGFPNLFFLVGPNTGLGHNSMIFMIEAQVRYIVALLRLAARTGARSVEVRPEAQDRFNRWVQEKSRGSVWLRGGCASWYLDAHGVNRALWPASTVNFWLRMRRVRPADFHLEGAST
ncbi:MAG TPA: NAD(P)/FAD-dependent oxidoreductase, partial [Streptosporangiaceae bacterium]|nr:NAD(P)/FAD-dependent oxidoreductase [Streptosporangiaceae bacterium]